MHRLVCGLLAIAPLAWAQGTVPTFRSGAYTLAGGDPAQASGTTIPVVLVPVTLTFDAAKFDAAPDVPRILASPVFTNFAFAGGAMQYADALLRASVTHADGWHTLLGRPELKPVRIAVPAGYGYVLRSKKTERSIAIADVDYVKKQLFAQVPKQEGKLVIAVAHDTAWYVEGDATICCSWGAHGVDASSGNSFVLSTYLDRAPAIVQDRDVQPLTQQLAEFVIDPLGANRVPAWRRTQSEDGCGGTGVGSAYFQLEPTDTNPKNDFPASPAFVAGNWHLENAALLSWYSGASSGPYSFPDPHALAAPAQPCAAHHRRRAETTAAPVEPAGAPNGHRLIGYWTGNFPLREVSPQWDVIIVAFATPDHKAPEGTLRFRAPKAGDLKADIAWMKGRGRKVMLSLGGGGEYFTLADAKHIPDFVSSVAAIVSEYGFDGVDIDFETPSLVLDSGDTDFRHPTTPSVVNLIAGLRQLRERFGPGFMISLVPEGPQIPAGFARYGGQFGSYLPIAYALRDILSFVDVQDYNTPPVEGLDGEIYQSGGVDYHAALTELLLHGFNAGGHLFPPMPADKIAVGFLTGYTKPALVSEAMRYIVSGKAPAGTAYMLRKPGGYPDVIGAMFWTIDDDRGTGYSYSNLVGPQLHRLTPLRESGTSGTASPAR